MLTTISSGQVLGSVSSGMSDDLEHGRIVHFPECPLLLPDAADLEALRAELPRQLKLKNVSYHPEADRVLGIEGDPELAARARRVLKDHAERLVTFLRQAIPTLADGWTVGTSSFRPMQEKGRNLKPHASNELVHIDAGAYGATNGDRILRFFVNVSPDEDRVWATRGTFPELYEKYGEAAGIVPARPSSTYLEKRISDRVRTGVLGGLSQLGLPLARVLDSSPYDRVMRRFHNYMKDDPVFREGRDGYEEFRFRPGSAWMVLTDMVSHACLSGQHALVSTFLVPLRNCRLPELVPLNVLKGR